MVFNILPYFLFEIFRESGYTNNFLQTKIIGNPKLKWVRHETVEGIAYNRLKKKDMGKNKENFKK